MAIDALIALNLTIEPPDEEPSALNVNGIFVGISLVVQSPVLAAATLGRAGWDWLSPVSLTLYQNAVLGKPVLGQAGVYTLIAGSLALRPLEYGIRRCLGRPVLTENLSAPRQIITFDRHVRRGGDSYATAFSNLLPTGLAWPRLSSSLLMRVISGLAQMWGNWVDRRAADLLEQETDPRQTLELLLDWERNWGLPEECFAEAFTIQQRRDQLLLKMTLMGGQSRNFFMWIATWAGSIILITEYAPFMCGISQVGDTRDDQGDYRWQIGPPEMRFYWTVHVGNPRLTWFRASVGQAGIDPHLRIGLMTDLECLLQRWKPAHTEIVLDYSGTEAFLNPMAGTP